MLYKLYLAIKRTHGQDKSLISIVLYLFHSPAQAVLTAIPPATGSVSDSKTHHTALSQSKFILH